MKEQRQRKKAEPAPKGGLSLMKKAAKLLALVVAVAVVVILAIYIVKNI